MWKRHSVTKFMFRLKEKWMEFNAISLGLSLDMLIYIIRYSKPEADDCRFNL